MFISTGQSSQVVCFVMRIASSPSNIRSTGTSSLFSVATRSVASDATAPGNCTRERQDLVDGRDLTIVNPRHLEPGLRMAVCEQCHLLGDHRVDRLGRDTFDYRPGLPLTDFFAVYGRPRREASRWSGRSSR